MGTLIYFHTQRVRLSLLETFLRPVESMGISDALFYSCRRSVLEACCAPTQRPWSRAAPIYHPLRVCDNVARPPGIEEGTREPKRWEEKLVGGEQTCD
jgi:hypothetical protein